MAFSAPPGRYNKKRPGESFFAGCAALQTKVCEEDT